MKFKKFAKKKKKRRDDVEQEVEDLHRLKSWWICHDFPRWTQDFGAEKVKVWLEQFGWTWNSIWTIKQAEKEKVRIREEKRRERERERGRNRERERQTRDRDKENERDRENESDRDKKRGVVERDRVKGFIEIQWEKQSIDSKIGTEREKEIYRKL